MGEEGSVVGVVMKVPMLLARSISRISRVASIPDLTGSWISIWEEKGWLSSRARRGVTSE